jgi:phosphoribosylformylglycinamidine synthase
MAAVARRRSPVKVRVVVTLKTGVLDPQGKAIEGALRSLGIAGVNEVRQGKVFDLDVTGVDGAAAERLLKDACERLLANTVIENYRVELDGAPAGAAP